MILYESPNPDLLTHTVALDPTSQVQAICQVNCRPSSDPTPDVNASIAYAKAKGIGCVCIGLQVGATWADLNRMESADGEHKYRVGPAADDLVEWYATGCLNYHKFCNVPECGWVGSEFDHARTVFSMLAAAGLTALVYLDGPGEFSLDPWSPTPERAAVINRLLALPEFYRRAGIGKPTTLADYTTAEQLNNLRGEFAAIMDETCRRMLRDAGHMGEYFLAAHDPAHPLDGQGCHKSFNAPGVQTTHDLGDWLRQHQPCGIPLLWADQHDVELAQRMTICGAGGATHIFADKNVSLDRLNFIDSVARGLV